MYIIKKLFSRLKLRIKLFLRNKKFIKKGSLELVNRYTSVETLKYNQRIEKRVVLLITGKNTQIGQLTHLKKCLEKYVVDVKNLKEKYKKIETKLYQKEIQKMQKLNDQDISFNLTQIERLQTRIDQMSR